MYCGLTELPSFLPPYLRRLNCIGNNITKLPPLPPSIEKMRLVGNPIKVLPVSIGNLDLGKELYDRNKFTYYDDKSYFQGNFTVGEYKKEKLDRDSLDTTGPLAHFIYEYCHEDVKQYAKYKWATDIISDWFLKIKYDPQFDYCKRRVKNEYIELMSDN